MIRRSPFRFPAVVLTLFLFLCSFPLRAYQTERVVLVIIDGLRYSEGLGDSTHAYTPAMTALTAQGAMVANFQNDGFTYTSRAIPAIWCGGWTEVYNFEDPDCGGSNNHYTELPSVFEYYRSALQRPAEDCIYTLKSLGCPWKPSFDPDYGPDFWPLIHSAGETDIEVWQETEQILAQDAPGFLLMYLADVDHAGHSGDWDSYTRAISIADSLVGVLWTTLQADPVYAGRTTLLVTNDHGRHDYDFQGHGDDCAGCRHIQLLAVGPDTPAGLISTDPRTIPDIAPTIGELLGFPTEQATGTAMTELFGSPDALEPAAWPRDLSLRIYPNPFNPSLTIDWRIPQAGMCRFSIHDLQGRTLKVLLEQELPAGDHRVTWKGEDAQSRRVASGLYLLRVVTRGRMLWRKVTLL